MMNQQVLIDSTNIKIAFESFNESDYLRNNLLEKLKRLEQAHRELEGRLPLIPTKFTAAIQVDKNANNGTNDSEAKAVDDYED
jgi:hypothetical protein